MPASSQVLVASMAFPSLSSEQEPLLFGPNCNHRLVLQPLRIP